MKTLDQFQGCLIGGAAGDALGYAVEFMRWEEIQRRYGKKGIQEFALMDGKARVSDDTQMTLFTANGLLFGATRGSCRGIMASYESYIWEAYKEWLGTQGDKSRMNGRQMTWLYNLRELHEDRAPGNTCIGAIRQNSAGGSLEEPANSSKGCGGVMRVAPVGLFLDPEKLRLPDPQAFIDLLGAKVAALTHGHPLGYIPAAALTHIISRIVYGEYTGENSLEQIIQEAVSATEERFRGVPHVQEFAGLMRDAIALSKEGQEDVCAIRKLGEGWVAEETLAIAVYSALKYSGDFSKAIHCAVNHDGDSDSTGSVTGNILGAWLGARHIQNAADLSVLELKETILEIAGDLFAGCRMSEYGDYFDLKWYEKYIDCSFGR